MIQPLPPPLPQQPVLEYQQAVAANLRFGIHGWAWISYLAAMIVYVPLSLCSTKSIGGPSYLAGYLTVAVLGTLLLCLIPALLAFYIGKRSRMAASVTFVVMLGICLVAEGETASQAHRRKVASSIWTKVNSQLANTGASMVADAEAGTAVEPAKALQRINSLADSTKDASQVLTGEGAAGMRAIAGFLKRMGEEMAPHATATSALRAKNPLTPGWIKSREDIADARSVIEQYRKTNVKARELLDRMEKFMRDELANQGLPPSVQARMSREVSQKIAAGRPLVATIRDLDDTMADELLRTCDLLEDDWGKWQWDTDRKLVIFENSETRRRFIAISSIVQGIAEKRIQIEKQYYRAIR